ncbi:hypothetical protein KAI68_04950, partial [bacterium]|nr:hypothetical protein [bacterium]
MKRKYLTFYKIGLFFLVYLGFMFIFNIKVWAGTLITLSSTSYDRGNSEIANGVAADSNNNIIITGESYNGTNYDWFTIKYDSNLVIISSIVYDAGGSNDELAYDVTVDGNDNIIVTGYSNNGINDNYFTIKYDNNLVVITSAGYDGGGDDVAYGVTVDGNNNIIVAGYTTIIIGLDRDYLTIKYDSNLVIISSVAYDVSNFDYAEGVATDDNNNIIVTGKVNDDYLTVKYDSNLMVISSATYDGFSADWAYGVTADSNNDIIVTGERFNGTEYDYLTIKYDSNLVVISSVAYDGGSNDYAEGVTTDDTNNIIVVGGSRIGGD